MIGVCEGCGTAGWYEDREPVAVAPVLPWKQAARKWHAAFRALASSMDVTLAELNRLRKEQR